MILAGRAGEECNPGKSIPTLPTLGPTDTVLWPSQVDAWGAPLGLKVPGKRVVASRLVELGKAVPSDEGKAVLVKLHADLLGVLKS